LSARQLHAVGAGAARELGWGLRAVRSEVAEWRTRALAISDPALRSQALEALADKRPLLDGAAFFWILPDRRCPELLRLLVAFQALANYHDHASERAGQGRPGPGSSMAAFLDVVDLDRPLTGYGDESTADAGVYLRALAQTCRSGCHTLPNYRKARPLLLRHVHRARSLDLEHDPAPQRRTQRLRRFADHEFGARTDASWWELTAGAASLLTAIVLLALAADEQTTDDDLLHAAEAYSWVASTSAFLDNYVDQLDDAASGAHNYLNYYPATDEAVRRIATLIDRSLREAAALRHGSRHVVIVASMTALYLSSDSARSRPLQGSTRELAASGGTLTRLLIPILRGWRIAYRESSAC
jgi:tetraprenyl-beta-curcumene synthase